MNGGAAADGNQLGHTNLRHGSIAIAAIVPPVLAVAHPGPTRDDVADGVAELRARGARARMAGACRGQRPPLARRRPRRPGPHPRRRPGQQLALALARLPERDDDAPPGLSKVTIT